MRHEMDSHAPCTRTGSDTAPSAREISGKRRSSQGNAEQLIPEDVPPVGLAVQAARGHARVEVGGVRGESLQQVEGVQPDDLGRLGPSTSSLPVPQSFPCVLVPSEQVTAKRLAIWREKSRR